MTYQRELFAQAPVRSDYGRRSPRRPGGGPPRRVLFLLVIVIACVVVGVGVGYLFGGSDPQGSDIPTIKAELPIKQRPEQPGGIDIPHQDVTVFDKLDPKAPPSDPQVEHLLPPAEVPQQTSIEPVSPLSTTSTAGGESVLPRGHEESLIEKEAAPDASLPTQGKEEDTRLAKPEKEEPLISPSEAVAGAQPAFQKPELPPVEAPKAEQPKPKAEKLIEKPKVEAKPKTTPAKPDARAKDKAALAPKKLEAPATMGSLPAELFKTGEMPKSVKAPAAAATTTSASNKRVRFQLASQADKAKAQAELVRLQKRYGSSLGSAKLLLLQGTYGGKTVYRVQSAAMPEAEAKKICAALSAKGGSCLLVTP